MSTRHVALLIETSREFGRGLLRGIIRYQREFGPWSSYFKPHGLEDSPPHWLQSWKGDGILARINDRKMAEAVLQTGIPTVDLRGAFDDLGLTLIGIDNREVVHLAVDHFLDRGFRHFAFCGTPRGENRYQDERADRFQQLLVERGFPCDMFFGPTGRGSFTWEEEQHEMAKWLSQLARPVAVMTCHDDRGQQVLDACQRANLAVPDEAAVLGVDNDPFLCNLSTPPLSSIDVDPERIGYEAAAVLDRMMRGDQPPSEPIAFPPRCVITRQSTDMIAISDPDVASAVRLIREHACKAISIEQILQKIPVSRTSLFRRFKWLLGRSPKEEMTRVRMEAAKSLLRDTDLPVSAIAARVGYSEAKYFIEVFHKTVDVTPLRYRKKSRGAGYR